MITNGMHINSPMNEIQATDGAAPIMRLALAEHSEVMAHATAVARPKRMAVTPPSYR
jgi:hypothetical protein